MSIQWRCSKDYHNEAIAVEDEFILAGSEIQKTKEDHQKLWKVAALVLRNAYAQ